MLRFNSIENEEPRKKKPSTVFRAGTIVAPDPLDPQYFYPAQPTDDAQGICGEEIRAVDTDFASDRRFAVDFPVNDSDEFEAIVTNAIASSGYENQTFDVDAADATKVDISVSGTQFIYMRTTDSSATVPDRNVAIFRFNRGAGPAINS